MRRLNKVLLIDLRTNESTLIHIDGLDGIRRHFTGDVRGKTLQKLTDNIFLREWKSCKPGPGIVVIDAYAGETLKQVDIPITAQEFCKANL